LAGAVKTTAGFSVLVAGGASVVVLGLTVVAVGLGVVATALLSMTVAVGTVDGTALLFRTVALGVDSAATVAKLRLAKTLTNNHLFNTLPSMIGIPLLVVLSIYFNASLVQCWQKA
jgi:hypothetical protein